MVDAEAPRGEPDPQIGGAVTPRKRRRRLGLTLRALMVLVAVLSVPLAWQVHKARQQMRAVEAVKRHGGWVYYDYEMVKGRPEKDREPLAPGWLRRLIGDAYFQTIVKVDFSGRVLNRRYDLHADDRPIDDALAALSTQAGLKSLAMNGPQATDTGLAYLRRLTELEHLSITGPTEISDAGLANLRGLVNLKALYVSDCRATDDGFLSLSPLANLEILVLGSPDVTDRGLAVVAGMGKLKWLSVGGTNARPSRISDAGLKHVGRLKDLKKFDARFSRVGDKGVSELKGLPRLEYLDLDGCRVHDEGMRSIAMMRELKILSLNGSYVGDDGLKYLEGLTKLYSISLGDSGVSDEAKQAFMKAMPSLKHIE